MTTHHHNHDTTTMQLNPRLARRPTFRGLPVPYFASTRPDGTPDFKVIDETRRIHCMREKRCWICGEFLGYWMVFVGGPRSAESRLYLDGPSHKECVDDALRLCPFILGKTGYTESQKAPPRWKQWLAKARVITLVDPVAPETMVLYTTRRFSLVKHPQSHEILFLAAPGLRRDVPRGPHAHGSHSTHNHT